MTERQDTQKANPTGFDLSAYGAIVDTLRRSGYEIVDYDRLNPAQPHLVLRHDVDFDLGTAVAMAEFEASRGFQAIYFVLVRTEFYNVFTIRGTDAVRRIRALGHEVGLHFDAAQYPLSETNFPEAVARESDLLERATDSAVRTVTFHRPGAVDIDYHFEIPRRINEYSWRGQKEMGYCSDSQGTWRYGHPLDHPAVSTSRALELLTHPLWWANTAANDPIKKLTAFLERRRDFLDREIAANCLIYRSK